MATHAHSIGAPAAPPPNSLEALIDAVTPLADEIVRDGPVEQIIKMQEVIACIADLAIAEDDLKRNLRLKARAMRLIYAGDARGLEGGFREDSLNGDSRAEQLALQIISVTANAR